MSIMRGKIPSVFFRRGYQRQVTVEELVVYHYFYFIMNFRTRLCQITIGELEDHFGMDWVTINGALNGLVRKGFIQPGSTRLSDDRDYRKDLLTYKIPVLR